jgi:hypothetical protein
MDHVGVAPHGSGLVGLELPDEVPRLFEVVQFFGLQFRLLVAVLTKVTHSESEQISHESCRVKLGHHNERDLTRVTLGRSARLGNAVAYGAQPLEETT